MSNSSFRYARYYLTVTSDCHSSFKIRHRDATTTVSPIGRASSLMIRENGSDSSSSSSSSSRADAPRT